MEKKYILFMLTLFLQMIFAQQSYKMSVARVTSLQQGESGEETVFCMDNNLQTMYHSKWNQSGIPDQLNFYFTKRVKSVNKLIYYPRATQLNGVWTSIKISYSTINNPTVFTDATGIVTLAEDNIAKTIDLASTIVEPAVIRIDVLSAKGNYSSCAEMEFYSSEEMEPISSDCVLPTDEFAGYSDIKIVPESAGSSASSFQPGENIEKSFDGDTNTLYHSTWDPTPSTFPVSLIYKFDGQTSIDYLKYIPRQDGGENGYFGNVKISYNTTQDSNYVPLVNNNFMQNGNVQVVNFQTIITPLHIKIEVEDGKNNFASCAEMEFYRKTPNVFNMSAYSNIFSNATFSELKSGVTQQDIDMINSPFIKGLAQCLINNNYQKKYRAQKYQPYKTLSFIRNHYKIANYNSFENPTGIAFQANTRIVVFAENIGSDAVFLKVKDFANENSATEKSYDLVDGINFINITNDGLGYISYYTDNSLAAPVTVNITGGRINGFYTKDTPAEEWQNMITNDVYPKIDVEGYYTKAVLDKFAVKSAHYSDVKPLIDKYDMTAKSQRELMGFFKFNKNIKNRQLIYTESSGGWFAGGLGTHFDLTWGLQNIVISEGMNVWGLAHELGHINQIRPGLNWVSSGDVTNNIYSTWAQYHLYTPNGLSKSTREEWEIGDQTVFPKVTGNRFGEFIIQTQINKKSYFEYAKVGSNGQDNLFRSLIPLWQLELYYQLAGASKGASVLDFDMDMSDEATQVPVSVTGIDYAHWYASVAEKVRNTDESQLTEGQLIMNFVKNTCDAVQEDLTDFFTNTGFLIPIDAMLQDYTNGQMTITQDMINEVKNYVLSKGYAKPTSPVINYISAYSINAFKNMQPLTGTTGVGVEVTTNTNGRFLLVDNSKWNNAVAFETYDATDNLMSVSIVGTGDLTLAGTYVNYPQNALKVYAVGYDGQKILVYPSDALSVSETEGIKNLRIYPNPVKNGDKLIIDYKSAKGIYNAEIHHISGALISKYKGTISELNEKISNKFSSLEKGVYIISVANGNENYKTKIIRQ